jgi:4-hydroxy-tetrahydrodipicolinate synthase
MLLSGDDASLCGFLAHGGDGCISVAANVAPRLVKSLINSWFTNNIKEMMNINNKLLSLNTALFVESNPIPVKYMLAKQGLIQNELRLPLTPASHSAIMQIENLLAVV